MGGAFRRACGRARSEDPGFQRHCDSIERECARDRRPRARSPPLAFAVQRREALPTKRGADAGPREPAARRTRAEGGK